MKCSSEIQICSCHLPPLISPEADPETRNQVQVLHLGGKRSDKVSQAANKEYVIKPVINCKQLNPPGKNPETRVEHTPQSYLTVRNREWSIYELNSENHW